MARRDTVVTSISKISERGAGRNAALVVIHGGELGRKYDLGTGGLIIGRSSVADILVDHESVSRNHASLTPEAADVVLRDMESTNGTWINDEQLKGGAHRVLRSGDLIKVGRTILKFIAGNNVESIYHDEVYRLTTVDGLTQAHNRRYFDDTLEREVSRCRRYGRWLSLVLMDIDRFKQINDTFGHLAGDVVLRDLAARIRSSVRREDVLARFGGEEFALLLPEVQREGAVAMAEKVRLLAAQEPFRFDGQLIPVTVSLGVATLPEGSKDGGALVRVADGRLYAAKDAGRNRVAG